MAVVRRSGYPGVIDAERCDERTATETSPTLGPPGYHRHQAIREFRERRGVHG